MPRNPNLTIAHALDEILDPEECVDATHAAVAALEAEGYRIVHAPDLSGGPLRTTRFRAVCTPLHIAEGSALSALPRMAMLMWQGVRA